jgi:hypothetical protein
MDISHEQLVATKKQRIMKALDEEGLTEKAILQKVGDNRYSREIIRNLLQNGQIYRHGKVRCVAKPLLSGCAIAVILQ